MLLFLGTALVLTATCLLLDFLRRRRSSSLSMLHQLQIYAILRCLDVMGAYHDRRMERNTRNFMKEQHQLMSTILSAGRRTRYGRDHGLSRMRSLSDFRSQHPVTTYPHYAAYIDAVERGDETTLLGDDDVLLFAASSGTTGANKHLPVGRKQLGRILRDCAAIAATTERVFGGGAIGRVLLVTSRMRPTVSASGKRVCSLSPILQRSALSRLRGVTPLCADEVETETAACYVGLLFALGDAELYAVFCSFIYVFLRLMGVLESQWPRLVSEIAAGRIGDHLALSEPLLQRINTYLSPAPDRAAELEHVFSDGFDGIVPRLWPRLRFVQAARAGLGGDMYSKLANRYLGSVPALDLAYCSSEAWLGVGHTPTAAEPTFTLVPDSCLYEFLPVTPAGDEREPRRYGQNEAGVRDEADRSRARRRGEVAPAARRDCAEVEEQAKWTKGAGRGEQEWNEKENDEEGLRDRLLLADELQVGSEYELVVTTRSGLYRYRQGDVVRVTEFHNQAPIVQLLYRMGLNLSVQGAKVPGVALFQALQSAAAHWPGRAVLEFAAAESVLDPTSSVQTPHQLLFLELSGPRLSEAEANLVDSYLRSVLQRYSQRRKEENVGPMRVLQIAPGAFHKLRDGVAVRGQAHWSQVKKLHVLRRPEDVALLMSHVLPPSE